MQVWGNILLVVMMFLGVGLLQAHDDLEEQGYRFWPEQVFTSQGVRFNDVMYQYNICGQVLYEANKDAFDYPSAQTIKNSGSQNIVSISPWLSFDVGAEIVIPAHESCFDVITFQPAIPADFEIKHNICFEDYAPYLQSASFPVTRLYIPHDVLPCYNAQGQRLRFYDEAGVRLKRPYYTTEAWIGVKTEDVPHMPYCVRDLWRNNPQRISYGSTFAPQSAVMFVGNVKRCHRVTVENDISLYELSRQYNVCMEVIQPLYVGGQGSPFFKRLEEYTFDIPEQSPACYDNQGNRIGHDDREVYATNINESMIDVAKKHGVCVQDLLLANPHLIIWPYVENYSRHVFIPETPPCDFTTVTHVTQPGDNLQILTYIYNVCFNRIYDANIALFTKYEGQTLPVGVTVTIPNRPPCYTYKVYCGGRYREPAEYVCYQEPVDFDKDYTGIEPPVSPVPFNDTETCYTMINGMTVIFNNQTLKLSKREGLPSYMIAACYGITVDALFEANAINYPPEVKPEGWLVVPNPQRHCEFEDAYGYRNWYPERHAKMGQLDNQGVYTVDYNDTLSSIGRRFGYLPSMIAAENHLEAPYWIYPYQELQMPRMPSLYDIGKSVLYVGGVGVGMIGFGLYRMRRRNSVKKKQKPAA
jgi:LysM repeat protein